MNQARHSGSYEAPSHFSPDTRNPREAVNPLAVVDISPLLGGRARERRRVAEALGQAAETFGFFYIEGHGIEQTLIDAVYAQAATWFRRPAAEKDKYYIGCSRNHRGYVPPTEQGIYEDEGARHYEAFDLALDLPASDPDVARGHYLLGPNVWPSQTGFRKTVGEYYTRLSRLGRALSGAFETYLDAPAGTLQNAMTKPTSQLRLLHYLENQEPSAESDADMNMGAHTDYECFTILHQGAPGLQVLDKHDRWIDAPPIPGTFAVNLGDMLETWSNGRLRSTVHRVANNGSERFSLPFFVAANDDAVVRPIASQVPRDERPAYKPIVAGHHLLGQLLRDFPYLRERYRRGLMKLPFALPEGNPFELSRLRQQPVLA